MIFININSSAINSVLLDQWTLSKVDISSQFKLLKLNESTVVADNLTITNITINDSSTFIKATVFEIQGTVTDTIMIDTLSLVNDTLSDDASGNTTFFNFSGPC